MVKNIYNFVKKNVYGLVIFFLLLTLAFFFLFKKSYALDTKTYTRKEMQEMLVSTAWSLYYNSYFSDYGQRAMDGLGYTGEEGNYYNVGTLMWRDLNISPEEVGYSKYYHVDCSAYNFLIYKNTIGYDMSQYSSINSYPFFSQERGKSGKSYMASVSWFSDSQKYYREVYSKYGYGWNSGFLEKVALHLCGDKCKDGEDPFIYDNLDNKYNNELVYHYDSNGYRDLETIKAAYAIAKANLQPGDVIRYTSTDEEEATSAGHVMFYVGDDIMTSSNEEEGFTDVLLHSTGSDYNSSETSKNNQLRKTNSILRETASTFVEGRFDSVYGKGKHITSFSIFRPLNTVCDENDNCKISNNSYNVELTDTQLSNNEARVALKKVQVQQYMGLNKNYITLDGNSSNTTNIISEFNTVNVGDEIIYRLRLRNQLDNIETTGLTIEAEIPEGATYVSKTCTSPCRKDGNKLIWEDVSIVTTEETDKKDIVFKVKVADADSVVFKGYKIITPETSDGESKELQMTDLTLMVAPTQNGVNKDLLLATIDKFRTLLDRGQILYNANGNHDENIKNLDELLNDSSKTASVSGFGYIKMMYYNAFGVDLDNLSGTVSLINTSKIKNALFNLVPYPERNNFKAKGEDGLYPLYDGDTSTNVYARKLDSDTVELTGVEAKIASMLVPGLYGGKHLKGNDLGDRVKYLRSFTNNSTFQSDLEFGDIIVSFTNNGDSLRTYLYLGNDEYGPILTRFTVSTATDEPLFLYHTDEYLSTYYNDESLRTKTTNKPSNQILNELFSKDLFAVLRPSLLGTTVEYDYNGGNKSVDSYVAYDKYENLVTPTSDGYKLILDINNAKSAQENIVYDGTNQFECWATDSNLSNCVNDNSNVTTSKYQKLYAKWDSGSTIKLPKLVSDVAGYEHTGWYSDKELKNKVADVNSDYTINSSGTVTLYARWDIEKDFSINNYIVDDVNKYIDKIDVNTTLKNFLKNITLGNGYTIDVGYKEVDGKKVVYTGSKTIIFNKNLLVDEYTNIIRGEVNGDGKINYLDYVYVYNHIQKVKHSESSKKLLKNEYLVAADMDENGKINYLDFVKIYKKIKELKGGVN